MLLAFAGIGLPASAEEEKAGLTRDVVILFTSDVHCRLNEGFGFTGLEQIRTNLSRQGYEVLLVDNGDFIQGAPIGSVTKGESIIDLMNDMHYDVVIPGNHEFDYGLDQFFHLVDKADFPVISCNFNKEGKLVFPPYLMKEVSGLKIAFVGVTTPESLTSASPKYFQNDKARCCKQQRKQNLQTEGIADAFVVALPEILRRENADAGETAEDTEDPDKHQLIDDRDAGHGVRADAPDHDVVEHVDKVCNAILEHDRNGDGEGAGDEFSVEQCVFHDFSE